MSAPTLSTSVTAANTVRYGIPVLMAAGAAGATVVGLLRTGRRIGIDSMAERGSIRRKISFHLTSDQWLQGRAPVARSNLDTNHDFSEQNKGSGEIFAGPQAVFDEVDISQEGDVVATSKITAPSHREDNLVTASTRTNSGIMDSGAQGNLILGPSPSLTPFEIEVVLTAVQNQFPNDLATVSAGLGGNGQQLQELGGNSQLAQKMRAMDAVLRCAGSAFVENQGVEVYPFGIHPLDLVDHETGMESWLRCVLLSR